MGACKVTLLDSRKPDLFHVQNDQGSRRLVCLQFEHPISSGDNRLMSVCFDADPRARHRPAR